MDIGIFGLWGMNIPVVTFGGFDYAFSEIGWRLAEQGHKVTIYCRRERYPENCRPRSYKGINLVYVPTIDIKDLSFLTALTNSLIYAFLRQKHDIYLFVNVGSGWHCFITKLLGKKVVLNVDGLDWFRGKWGRHAKFYFKSAANAGLFACDALITDAEAMVDYYKREFGRELEMIAYGAYIENSKDPSLISQFNIRPKEYYLIAGRLVPENNADLIMDAFKKVDTDKKLVIAGDANYDSIFHQKIRNNGDPRVIFTGWINDQDVLKELHCNSYAYLHGHSVGGTNPALLQALGCSNMIVALNTPFNSEVLDNGRYGIQFEGDVEDLRGKLQFVEDNPAKTNKYRQRGPERIREKYNWELITKKYLILLKEVMQGRSDSSRRIILFRIGILLALILVFTFIISKSS